LTTILVHRNGRTEQATSIDRAWLNPASGVALWVDIAPPSVPESLILSDTFGFHALSVEDAMSTLQYPKVEPYDGYLYVVLHGLAFTKGDDESFKTKDIDFFLGRNFLVTVHDGTSRSIAEIREHCPRNHHILGDGPVALFHRIVDLMIDRYLPEIEEFVEWMDEIEDQVFSSGPAPHIVRDILDLKRQVSALRRIAIPQRDVIGRLARREFTDISSEMAYHFRDVYDSIVRLNDEAMMLQDRITGVSRHIFRTSVISQRGDEGADMSRPSQPMTLLTGMGHERPAAAPAAKRCSSGGLPPSRRVTACSRSFAQAVDLIFAGGCGGAFNTETRRHGDDTEKTRRACDRPAKRGAGMRPAPPAAGRTLQYCPPCVFVAP
jgi:magnesium transporter